MSAELDPEELQELLSRYQETCGRVVKRFDGFIAQYLGDGILVYFGYPKAHEDDSRRAVLAGLEIIESMVELNREINRREDPLRVRIGIHTGLVVAGSVQGDKERLALGQAPNVAARIQGMADPDTVAISSVTHRLTQGYFECESLGSPAMKGISEAMEIFRVIGTSGATTRLDVAGASGLTRGVGRRQELDELRARFSLVTRQQRQAVMIRGEAGIGKSRLMALFRDEIEADAATWMIANCSPYAEHSTFAPIIGLLENYFRITRAGSNAGKLRNLERGLQQLGSDLSIAVPVICDLIGLEHEDNYQAVALPPDQRKQLTITTVIDLLKKIAETKPLILLVEDLHWSDPSTLELLGQLLIDPADVGLLTVFTYRTSFVPPWDDSVAGHIMHLDRLPQDDVEALISAISGETKLPQEAVRLITERTDGIPLFVEELTKSILDSEKFRGASGEAASLAAIREIAVPASLHSLLVARLDRLQTVRESAQLGAVLGREFSYDLLQSVSSLDDGTLRSHLDRLVDEQVLLRYAQAEEEYYEFRHALIRDAAYDTLLKKDRIEHHRVVADTLVNEFQDTVDTRPELAAYHYTEAGSTDAAIEHWQRAGQRAVERFANAEAITHFGNAVELIGDLPESADKVQTELHLQIALGSATSIREGWQSRDAAAAYERAYELCADLPDSPDLFWVLWQLGSYYQTESIAKGNKIAEQLLRMAHAADDPVLIIEAQFGASVGLVLAGKFAEAYELLQKTESLYDGGLDRARMSPTGQNNAINNLLYLGLVEFLTGRPQSALQRAEQAVDLARRHAGPPHLAAALVWQGFQLALNGESAAALRNADEAIPLATEFFVGRQWAGMLRGWALAHEGVEDDAILQMEEASSAYRASGFRALYPFMLMLMASGQLACGRYDECLRSVAEALDVSGDTGETFLVAEIYRIRGEALRLAGDPEAAESAFEQSIAVAKAQGANTLLLKAVLSEARLIYDRGDPSRAKNSLSQVCETMGDGAGLKVLEEAREFLDDMRGS